ncbi:threonine/homoserine efflux transporter RhtA [Nocardioides albertanoniae]|uniref:Threonine/homoserine efflux transporter RhtA n=1 Tax=Nocardioides albertanoniae TaxID=1175486 RepID=A0A543A4J8_9ACTN|nr:DMT family transporter [Nocardioides albertanoniae]TQL67522.1 threonine/homoserine efflux transporter RhtA [Nocardioides albertanoniae]
MATLTNDDKALPSAPKTPLVAAGLLVAVVSAVTFSLSGPLGRGLFDTGWSTGGVLIFRVGIGAVVLAPFAVRQLAGRWRTVVASWRAVVAYALLAIVVPQFAFFSAVQWMAVGPALLVEYMGVVLVVAWMWARHGERPSRLTMAGALVAIAGLVLVLDLVSGADVDPIGILWASGAAVGLAGYFVLNAHSATTMPPLPMAWLGLSAATVLLGVLCLVGAIPFAMATAPAVLAGWEVAWWVPLIGLGVLTCSVAYATGIAASRRLGSRLSSFVGLLEVVSAVVFAWLLLGEAPAPIQIVGGLVVLAGIIAVRQGERATRVG